MNHHSLLADDRDRDFPTSSSPSPPSSSLPRIRQPRSNEPSLSSPPTHYSERPSLRTRPQPNDPQAFHEPDDYYRQAFNASQNGSAVHENALTSASSHNPPSAIMASTLPKPSISSSRTNGSSSTSKNPDFPVQRREVTRAVGTRSVSDSHAPKVQAAKASPAVGIPSRSVKELADRLEKQAETSKSSPKAVVVKPPLRLATSHLRQAHTTTPSDRSSAASENVSTTRAGQAAGAKVGGTSRPASKGRNAVEVSSTPTSRGAASTRTPGARKPSETSNSRGVPPTSIPPCECLPKQKPLLFGEVPAESTTGIGYGIPSNHACTRTTLASAAGTTVISLQATESDNPSKSPAAAAPSVPGEQEGLHKRSQSDKTVARKAITRRPLHHIPSSNSSTSSEARKIRPPGSRIPNYNRAGDASTSCSTSPTRSNSPLHARTSPRAAEKLKSRAWSPSGQAPGHRSPSKSRYPGRISPSTSRTGSGPASRSSRALQSFANKSTSASRNRSNSQNGSPRTLPASKTPVHPSRSAFVDHNIPVDKVDFVARQAKIRQRYSQGIHKQEQSELRRRQSQCQTSPNLTGVKSTDNEVKKEEECKEIVGHNKTLESVKESEPTSIATDVDKDEQASERLPLRLSTAAMPLSPVNQTIEQVIIRKSVDSLTLGLPGSFPSAEPSPVCEEAPLLAVSNCTDTTDIDDDPQEDLEIAESFHGTVPAFQTQPPSTDISSNDSVINCPQENLQIQPGDVDISDQGQNPPKTIPETPPIADDPPNNKCPKSPLVNPQSRPARADISSSGFGQHSPKEIPQGQPASIDVISRDARLDSPEEIDSGYLFSAQSDTRTPDTSLGQSSDGGFQPAITLPMKIGSPQPTNTGGLQLMNSDGLPLDQGLLHNDNWETPAATTSGQRSITSQNDAFLSQVHDSLKDPEDESLDERSYAPSYSNARTSQTDRHSAAWTDYSVTTASDAGIESESAYDRPPTPPPKMIQPSHTPFVFNSVEARPSTSVRSVPSRHASPPLPMSPPVPAVPPKPSNYSPLPSPRMTPPKYTHAIEDGPASPRSARFGATSGGSSHRKTSSGTPHYAPGQGWLAQPPVPNSRPGSVVEGNHVRPPTNDEDDASSGTPDLPETEEQVLAKQKEAKAQRDRDNVVKEIVDSEAKHVKDMYVIKEIWQGTADACPKLTEKDKEILFGNISEIATFGAEFLESLKKVKVSDGRRVLKSNPEGSRTSSEDKPREPYDSMTNIGGVFVNYIRRIEQVNWPFIIGFQNGQAHLEVLLKDPAIRIWDQECRRAMVDISECWDLKSLIIKPFQRIIKYKDLLERLISKTPPNDPDLPYLEKAFAEMKDFLARLNQAMPDPEPKAPTPKPGKRNKETDTRTGFMKTLARKTGGKLAAQGVKPTDEDEDYNRLRTIFSDEYVRLQVVLRDVEYYTRQTNEFVNHFLKILSCVEMFILSRPTGAYAELESKWTRFSIGMQSMRTAALPEHIAAVRTQFITPLEQLIELYTNPNLRMAERAKRRMDWEKIVQKKTNLTFTKESQKSKSEKHAERYVALNDQLKRELPLLSMKTNTIANICLGRFIMLQRDWYDLWQQKVKIVLEDSQIPPDIKSIVDNLHNEFAFVDAAMKELSIANKSFLKDSGMGRSSTQESLPEKFSYSRLDKGRESMEQMSRPPSSNGRIRPPALSSRSRNDSANGSPLIPTPDFGRHSDGGFITPMDPSPPVIPQSSLQFGNGLGLTDSSSRFHDFNYAPDTMVNSSAQQSSGRPSTSRTSTSRNRPFYGGFDGTCEDSTRKRSDVSETAYPPRDPESAYYFRRESDPSERSFDYTYDRSRPVSGSTTFSGRIDGPPLNGRAPSGLDGAVVPNRPCSGVFQSAMPLSDEPEPYNTRMSRTSSLSSLGRSDERGRKDGYNVLYLAASLFEFHISDTKREGIYPYLTYEAGELFDVIGEKGELWLAKNQDDPPDKIKVGWIWSKHFARLAD